MVLPVSDQLNHLKDDHAVQRKYRHHRLSIAASCQSPGLYCASKLGEIGSSSKVLPGYDQFKLSLYEELIIDEYAGMSHNSCGTFSTEWQTELPGR
jgi:hypothetical protein